MAKQKKRTDGRLRKAFTYNSKRYYTYGYTAQELEDNYLKKKLELESGKEQHDNPTFNQYYEIWTNARRGTVKESTMRCQYHQYKTCSKIHISSLNKVFGEMKLKEITTDDIRELQTALQETNKPQGVNDKIAHLSHVFSDAVKERRLAFNPCIPVKNLKRVEPPASETIHRALTVEETDKFFEAAKNSAYYDLFRFAVNTGMRVGEIGALYEGDISGGFIHVQRTLTRSETGYTVIGDSTKTSKGQRNIPVNDDISEIIAHQKQINRMLYGDKVVSMQERIFKAPEGGLLIIAPINREIARICKKVGVEVFSMHSFRATFASRCVEAGMKPKVLQELLGHSSFSMTMDLYAHVMDDTKKEAMKSIKVI
jgi:Site-specific recombinase XerD